MPREFVTTPANFGKTVDRLVGDVAKRIEMAGKRAVHMAALEGQKLAVEEIGKTKPFKPVDTHELRRSYKVRLVNRGRKWMAILENVAPHAPHMEFGTRPHWVPIEPLIRWAERKLRGKGRPEAPPAKKRGRPTRTKPTGIKRVEIDTTGWSKAAVKRLPAAHKFAFRVRESIAKHGTKPREFHLRASKRFGIIMKAHLINELRKVR